MHNLKYHTLYQRLFVHKIRLQHIAAAVIAIVIFGCLGVYLLSTSHAATYVVSGEAESGTLNGNAAVTADATASGGESVMFGTNTTPASWWKPGIANLPWQWELDHEIVTTNAADMGTGDSTANGGSALAPAVYDIDGVNNTAADVTALHNLGKKVICYVEVGSAGNYYGNDDGSTSYYAELQATGDFGTKMQGYPEYYLNINTASTITVVERMIHDQCAAKGFDGVEPDLDDSYTDVTGFTITEANEVSYLATLSNYAHSLGLAWGLKNGGDGGNPATFIPDMLPYIDFAVVEEPYTLNTINYFYPALYNANKAFFDAEYTNDTTTSKMATYCTAAMSDHVNGSLYDLNLDGKTRVPCQ